jgi:hypothetical protein
MVFEAKRDLGILDKSLNEVETLKVLDKYFNAQVQDD